MVTEGITYMGTTHRYEIIHVINKHYVCVSVYIHALFKFNRLYLLTHS